MFTTLSSLELPVAITTLAGNKHMEHMAFCGPFEVMGGGFASSWPYHEKATRMAESFGRVTEKTM